MHCTQLDRVQARILTKVTIYIFLKTKNSHLDKSHSGTGDISATSVFDFSAEEDLLARNVPSPIDPGLGHHWSRLEPPVTRHLLIRTVYLFLHFM